MAHIAYILYCRCISLSAYFNHVFSETTRWPDMTGRFFLSATCCSDDGFGPELLLMTTGWLMYVVYNFVASGIGYPF